MASASAPEAWEGSQRRVPRIIRLAERDQLPPGTPIVRTTRDWLIDGLAFVLVLGFGAVAYLDVHDGLASDALGTADLVAGVPAILLTWARRRWPVPLAVATALAGTFSSAAGSAALLLLFTVAVHRPPRTTIAVAVLNLATAVVYARIYPDEDLGFWWFALLIAVILAAVVAWGMFVRARRQLVLSLRDRAERAEAEQQLKVGQARDHERARIAREMHDVLAHRISLLSMHAGALEFRPDAPPEEVARAAGVIRESAHRALEDLRAVIGVLRQDGEVAEPTETTRPQPTLGDLATLLEESRAAGMRVVDRIEVAAADAERLPPTVGRTAYRVVQEGLTNARKHAPGARVEVRVSGGPERGLTVAVANPSPVGAPVAAGTVGALPGSGTGLVGLAERATLAGGSLDHGPTAAGGFRLRAWLPWTAGARDDDPPVPTGRPHEGRHA